MKSSASLLEKVPQPWAALVRPFLQRSHEFEDKEPLVAYYLRTHVAFLCMRQRRKDDKEGTAFLMTLLDALEASKASLGPQLQGVDGRTVLTKFALMLFARADDAERTGNASMAIVRLFYTASVLFEATAQFTDDGAIDSIAAQKSKYAKYIAARMKKALDKNEPYVSPNKLEAVDDEAAGGVGGSDGAGQATAFTTAPASCFMRPTPQPTSDSNRAPVSSTAHGNIPASPYALASTTQRLDTPPPPYTQDFDTQGRSKQPAQPSPMASIAASQKPQHPSQQQQQQQQQDAAPPSAGVRSTGFKPSVDQMIDAQQLARQAVSALQFYDYENAKQQLVASLRVLNGVQ
ncbi:hypothetical protein, conserved [Leishmania tarentolae]|uniref:Vta1/callose synthase N-terminal domain-containing protein n=1 Tax=Leishmania tarentolae TaxID=5689 RepID=A0A640K9M2_LEITA|nr:hypothetical protein, conserved [Leishmania tarentolae]